MIRDAVALIGLSLVSGGLYKMYAPLAMLFVGGVVVWVSWKWRPNAG